MQDLPYALLIYSPLIAITVVIGYYWYRGPSEPKS